MIVIYYLIVYDRPLNLICDDKYIGNVLSNFTGDIYYKGREKYEDVENLEVCNKCNLFNGLCKICYSTGIVQS